MKYALTFGSRLIEDILNPDPACIDVKEIIPALARIKRFSADPNALSVYQHVYLCLFLAKARKEPTEVMDYLKHHDDHEAIIGDIPGPLKSIIATETSLLERIEDALDEAIWIARGKSYWRKSGAPADKPILSAGKEIDKIAETVEWIAMLGQPQTPWNRNLLLEQMLPKKALRGLPGFLTGLLRQGTTFESKMQARLDPERLLREQRGLGLVG